MATRKTVPQPAANPKFAARIWNLELLSDVKITGYTIDSPFATRFIS